MVKLSLFILYLNVSPIISILKKSTSNLHLYISIHPIPFDLTHLFKFGCCIFSISIKVSTHLFWVFSLSPFLLPFKTCKYWVWLSYITVLAIIQHFLFSVRLLSVMHGHSFFHPRHNGQWPPTSKDFYTRSYFLRKSQYFPFQCSVLNKLTTGTIFITSLVWRGPWLGIELRT